MRYSILINIVLYSLVISCIDLENDKNYIEYIKYFEQQQRNITSHFPLKYKSIVNDYTYNVDTTAYFNTLSFNITIDNEEEVKRITKIYSTYKKYKINDPCIVVVNDFIKRDNIPFVASKDVLLSNNSKSATSYSTLCLDEYKILPNFWSNTIGYGSSLSGLKSNFKYIILDMKMGDNTYSRKLKSDVSYMPNFAKHGYSKGIAFNDEENIVIYWVILW